MPNHCTITEPNCLSNYTLKYHVVKPIAKAANETLPASQFGPDSPQLTLLRMVFRASHTPHKTCANQGGPRVPAIQKIALIGQASKFAGFIGSLLGAAQKRAVVQCRADFN